MGAVPASFVRTSSPIKYSANSIDIFDHQEMSNMIAEVPPLRAYFAKYIKLGGWMEKFPSSSPEAEVIQELFKNAVVFRAQRGTTLLANGQSLLPSKKIVPTTQECENSFHTRCSISISTATMSTRASIHKPSGRESFAHRETFATNNRESFLRREKTASNSPRTVDSTGFTDFGGVESSFSLQEMAAIFFVCIFPHFRESSMYKNFQRRRVSLCETNTNKRLDSVELLTQEEVIPSEEAKQEFPGVMQGGNHAQKLVYNAAALFEDEQLISMLSNTIWYTTHIPAIIDNSTLSVAIACCTADNNGGEKYPLVYVNKAFETLTGYCKQDVLHKSCKFLQGPNTNPEAVERIRAALKQRRAIKETLLNYKKNGREFKMLLVLVPCFDRMGVRTHILAVQMDVSVYPLTPVAVKLMQDLLALLPRMIVAARY